MSKTQKKIDKTHPDWRSTVNELREKQIKDYEKSLLSVMKPGNENSKGTKFGPHGKVLGSSGRGPTTNSNRYRRKLRETLASQLGANTGHEQVEMAVEAFKPNVLPLDVQNVILNKEKEKMRQHHLREQARRKREGQKAMAEYKQEESYKPKTHDVGVYQVGNNVTMGSSYKTKNGGRRKTRRRHRNKSHKNKSHKKSKRHRRR